jgi:hypothetical protein
LKKIYKKKRRKKGKKREEISIGLIHDKNAKVCKLKKELFKK